MNFFIFKLEMNILIMFVLFNVVQRYLNVVKFVCIVLSGVKDGDNFKVLFIVMMGMKNDDKQNLLFIIGFNQSYRFNYRNYRFIGGQCNFWLKLRYVKKF